nr:helitron helicase-like domain-containing protein [Tanacetum cinerariifolium]
MDFPYMSVKRRRLTASGAINSYRSRVVTNGDGTTVSISTVFGRLRDMLTRNRESPICRPPPVTTRSPYMFVESLGLIGSGVINSSDGRVVTRVDRTTVPISIVFGRFKDMPVSSVEAYFTAHTGISPVVSSRGSFPLVNHMYLCLDVGTRTIRHQIINFCPSNANVPNNGAISLNSSTAVNSEVVEADSNGAISLNSSTAVNSEVVEADSSSCAGQISTNGAISLNSSTAVNSEVVEADSSLYHRVPEERFAPLSHALIAEILSKVDIEASKWKGVGWILYGRVRRIFDLTTYQLLRNSHFMENICAYNQMFVMTSFGTKFNESVNRGMGPCVFKISGQIYHWIRSLCQEDGDHSRFLQMYIYDMDNEVNNRMRHFVGLDAPGLNPELVEGLIHLLDEHNGLVRLFRTARDRCNVGEIPGFKIRLYNLGGVRGYELPTSDVLGAIPRFYPKWILKPRNRRGDGRKRRLLRNNGWLDNSLAKYFHRSSLYHRVPEERFAPLSHALIGILNYHVNTPELQGYISYELEVILNGFGKCVKDFGLQPPPEHLLKDLENKLFMEEKNYNRELLMQDVIRKNISVEDNNKFIAQSSKDEAIPMGKETSEPELLYLMEYLNTINFPGFSPHELHLKVRPPIMLLRNVNLSGSFYNGTRMIVTSLMSKLIEAQIITGTKTLENKISLKFGKITSFHALPEKQSEFSKHHFEFVAYNQLSSRVSYRDENSNIVYPMLTGNIYGNVVEFAMWDDLAKQFNKEEIEKLSRPIIIAVSSCRVSKYRDLQLSATFATYYYINPETPEAEYAYTEFKKRYDMNPLFRYLEIGVRFTCEATITSVAENKSWNYSSCSQCNKKSTKVDDIYTCEDHGIQDPLTYKYNFKATVSDATAVAYFTFFTKAGEKITGGPCSELVAKYKSMDQRQLPIGLVNIIEFLREIQMRDKETVAKLQVLVAKMEPNARKKDVFISKLK